MKREQLGSRLGFIMLSAGCAIGCGNMWKFPWMCGQNGGGSFMLVYIICLIILGIPALTMEFAIGRAAQTSPLNMYKKLEKPGQKWGRFWHYLSDRQSGTDGILHRSMRMADLLFLQICCRETSDFRICLHDCKPYDQCDFPAHNGCPCFFHPVLSFAGWA